MVLPPAFDRVPLDQPQVRQARPEELICTFPFLWEALWWSFSYSGCSAWFEDVRLIIVAGLLMGVSLAIQSTHNARASGKVSRVTSADRVPVKLAIVRRNECREQRAAFSRGVLEELILSGFSRRRVEVTI
jgi:hypothetical protein